MSVIDLEAEKQNGLDESQLAERVMRLMALSETCEGPVNTWIDSDSEWNSRCSACGDADNPPRGVNPIPASPNRWGKCGMI